MPASAHTPSTRRTRPDEPRPLEGKRALLQARRARQLTRRLFREPVQPGDRSLILCATDGALTFVLRQSNVGLVVERIQRHSPSTRLAQTLLFTDHAAFASWCDADSVKFIEPALHDRLCREGLAILDGR
jgi:hypothetical protein